MSNELELLIYNWMKINLPELINNPKGSAFEHVDDLFGKWIDKSEWLSLSIECFNILLTLMNDDNFVAKPILSIPLSHLSNTLHCNPPNSRLELENDLGYEPPRIGLINWKIMTYKRILEEYQTPLPFNLMKNDKEGIYACYHEYRYFNELKNNWEFNRRISIEYFPHIYH